MARQRVAYASMIVLLSAGVAASAAEIKVVAGSAVTPVMDDLLAAFEASSGHKVVADFDAAIGAMTDRILNGEAADVVIVSGEQIELLARRGRVLPGSRVDLAKVGVGVFVRAGAPRPDIATVESFKQAMLAAKSIGYNDPAAGAPVGIYLLGLFERLGIVGEMQAKTTVFRRRAERFEAVARGDVGIGFNQISEILAAPGVELVGPLPPAIQRYTQFSSGIGASSTQQDAARAFVAFITSPQARAAWTARGFEPP